MTPTMQRRLFLVVALGAAGLGLGVIASGSLGENLVYYWDAGQVLDAGQKAVGATIRLGGIVLPGSLDWKAESNELHFTVEDAAGRQVAIHATGAPPQMFREGIGVVVEGTMTSAGVFESDRLMVKHSNEYRAPEEGEMPKDLYSTVEEI